VLLVLVGLVVASAAAAQGGGPLFGPRGDQAPRPAAAPAAAAEPDAFDRLMFERRRAQFDVQRRLAVAVRTLKGEDSAAAVWALVSLSFLYGVLHAVGPGHGKVVIASYLAATRDRIRRGVALSVASSVVQAVSAILLVGVLALILQLPQLETQANVRALEIASYALMVAIGVWMTVAALRGGHDHHHHDGHNHDDHAAHSGAPPVAIGGSRRFLAVAVAIGIRPCSGAVLVLLFSFAQGLVWAGIGATFAMAAGTAATLCALAILTISARQTALRLAEGRGARFGHGIGRTLSVGGALAVTGFGGLLLLAALGQPGSIGG
jgi:ABC-type nickel/cobalt efflux system permease component RcnA